MPSPESHPLDIENPAALEAYLRRMSRLGDDRPVCTVLTGGVSNRVVLVERPHKPDWVIKQALPKLRVAVDWFSSPDRIRLEALGLRWLKRLTPAGSVPDLVFEDADEHLLVMEAVPKPHQNWKRLLLEGGLNLDHIRQFGCLLGSIHRRALGFHDEIACAFDGRSFFESLRLEPYYQYAAHQLPEAAAFLEELIAQTRATRLTLVHGDFSPKNILIHRDRLVLLDHEVIHYGDPAFDLGFSLTHLLAKALHLAPQRRLLGQAALHYWQHYCAEAGPRLLQGGLETRAVRSTLGCLLARVNGRSPLEYLTTGEKQIQTQTVLAMLKSPPTTIPDLLQQFLARVETAFPGP
jgi:5-methylthioribose kinase